MKISRIVIFLLCMPILPVSSGEHHVATRAPGVSVAGPVRVGAVPKAGFRLNRLVSEYGKHVAGKSNEAFRPSDHFLQFNKGSVLIDARAVDDGAVLLNDLRKSGLRNSSRYADVVSGLLPVDQIRRVAALDSLRSIHATLAPIRNAGDITSQGDVALRADFARSDHGVDGSGVTVGVMSDSYNELGGAAADIASGDLPAAGVTVIGGESGACGIQIPCIDEGRAMLQIVHDIAPGADLLFHTALSSIADFANGIVALEAAGADVIVDDLLYLNEPMFEDGVVAQAVDAVNANGVAYYSAAGNQGRQAYEATFRDSGEIFCIEIFLPYDDCNELFERVGRLHDFDPGPGQSLFQSITIPLNATVTIAMQWDEAFGSALTDHEMVLLDETGTTWYEFGANDNVGTGEGWEVLRFTNDEFLGSGSTAFTLAITYDDVESIAPPGRLLKVIYYGSGITVNGFPSNSGTLVGHANAAGAAAVGAAFFADTPEFGVTPPMLESYSAAGGTPILFGTDGSPLPLPVVRLKPDFTAVDGVNTTFFFNDSHGDDGIDDFFGTSAAAPHAAGVAALLLEVDPAATPQQINGAMGSTAIEMTADGFDLDSGYGLIQADAAIVGLSTLVNTAPVAGFEVTSPADLVADFSDTSTDADGSISSWNWDFGGDGLSTAQHPTHTFSADGIYHVILTVTDDKGDRNAIIKAVRLVGGTVVTSRVLTVLVNGSGLVESSPAAIDCGSNCTALFGDGDPVTLTAGSGASWITVSQVWSGACAGAGAAAECQLVMDADKQAEVVFSCELMSIPQPAAPVDTTETWQCAAIEANEGFGIAPAGDVSFTAETGIALGAGFSVADQAVFRALIAP